MTLFLIDFLLLAFCYLYQQICFVSYSSTVVIVLILLWVLLNKYSKYLGKCNRYSINSINVYNVCIDEGRPLATVSDKPDAPSPSPQSGRRSWSSSPPQSLYNSMIQRKQHPDNVGRTSSASGR